MKYIASVSFGKDSLALLLQLIEKNYPLDEVVFYDTGMEFNCIYDIRDKIKPLLAKKGITYTELKPVCPFLYTMLEKPVHSKDGTTHYGYSWCGGPCRWGTGEKLKTIDKYTKGNYVYVAIAADETRRLERENQKKNPLKLYPLVEWRERERDCLSYVREQGYQYIEDGIDLYTILDRVSCWCCANKNNKELRAYYDYLPTYWQKMKDLQDKTNRPFKNGKTIYDYENEFKKQDEEAIWNVNYKEE